MPKADLVKLAQASDHLLHQAGRATQYSERCPRRSRLTAVKVPPTPPQPLARGSAPRSRRLLLLQTLYVNLNILQQLRDFSRFFPRAEPRGRGVDFQDCENLPLVKIEIFSRFSNFFLNFYRKSRFNFIFCDNFGSITIGEN